MDIFALFFYGLVVVNLFAVERANPASDRRGGLLTDWMKCLSFLGPFLLVFAGPTILERFQGDALALATALSYPILNATLLSTVLTVSFRLPRAGLNYLSALLVMGGALSLGAGHTLGAISSLSSQHSERSAFGSTWGAPSAVIGDVPRGFLTALFFLAFALLLGAGRMALYTPHDGIGFASSYYRGISLILGSPDAFRFVWLSGWAVLAWRSLPEDYKGLAAVLMAGMFDRLWKRLEPLLK